MLLEFSSFPSSTTGCDKLVAIQVSHLPIWHHRGVHLEDVWLGAKLSKWLYTGWLKIEWTILYIDHSSYFAQTY